MGFTSDYDNTVWRNTFQKGEEVVKIQMESLVPTLPKVTKAKRL
jgi:hypothetical protein